MPPPKSGTGRRGTVHGAAAHNLIKFVVRAAPLPKPVFDFLRDNLALLRRMQQERKSREEGQSSSPTPTLEGTADSGPVDAVPVDDEEQEEDEVDLQGEVLKRPTIKAEELWPTLEKVCKEAGGEWADLPERLWAFGPQRAGTCLLADSRPGQPTS
jgi:ribosome assembly protein 1